MGIDPKKKACRAIGKARGTDVVGCGKETYYRTHGLCQNCHREWLDTPEGQLSQLPRCKECNDRFEPLNNNPNQKHCLENDRCISAHAAKAKTDKEKSDNKEHAERKVKMKTKKDYEKDLEKVFNNFIRLRDQYEPCISCDSLAGSYKITAGHYFPQGSNKNIRFDEDNVHGQCWFNCNKNRHGNLAEYQPRLILKIGQERFDALVKRRNEERHYSIPELIEMKVIYKDKVKFFNKNVSL